MTDLETFLNGSETFLNLSENVLGQPEDVLKCGFRGIVATHSGMIVATDSGGIVATHSGDCCHPAFSRLMLEGATLDIRW
jgi:hypothetical protein